MLAYGPTVLRLCLGAVFVAHGGQKLFGLWDGPGLGGTADFFNSLGLAPPLPLAVVVAVTEFGGGLLLIAGAFARWVAIPLAIDMAIATWKVHAAHGFFLNWSGRADVGHGYEFHLVVLGALACIILTGAGALSVDEYRARSAELAAAGRARLRAGKV